MKVRVENKTLDINKLNVIGSGGEGLVVKTNLSGGGIQAIKVYHNPSNDRSLKLSEFFRKNWNLPTSKIALPLKPVYNLTRSLIVGVTMPYFGGGFENVALFSNKKKRITYGVTNKLVVEVFLDGLYSLKKIHNEGLIVGDLNDFNVLFRNKEMLWIDVDAWQFGSFACPVATLEFLDPVLYGVDLSKGPVFKKENDWYSFAVMLFKSLLLTHPYGGVHKKQKTLQKRALNKITVFDDGVKFPTIAFSPDILSDDLAQEFLKIFRDGKREVFPKEILKNYLHSLVECQNCHTFYPSIRIDCPVCSKRTLVVMTKPVTETKNVYAMQMFSTKGNIVYTKVQGSKIYLVTHHKNKAVLHIVDQNGHSSVIHLGKSKSAIRYALAGNLLVVNSIHSENLTVIDVSKKAPEILHKTVTEIFAPSRKAAFQVTQNKIVRIIGGNIMAIEKGGLNVIERHIRDGVSNQTWFSSNGNSHKLQLFGFIQVLKDRRYWYYLDGKHFEPEIPYLDSNEGLLDVSVKFSSQTVLLRRKTQKDGVDYLRTEIVNREGKVEFSNILKLDDHPVKTIHGQTYSNESLIHATDKGVLQEKVVGTKFKTFTETEKFVKEGDSLFKYGKGLLVVDSSKATYLKLTNK